LLSKFKIIFLLYSKALKISFLEKIHNHVKPKYINIKLRIQKIKKLTINKFIYQIKKKVQKLMQKNKIFFFFCKKKSMEIFSIVPLQKNFCCLA